MSTLSPSQIALRVLPGEYAVCKLDAALPMPAPPAACLRSGGLWALLCSPGESTLVCARDFAPACAVLEPGFRAMGVVGTLDFALTGILAGLTAALARARVSVYALSTFDTDYLLVREAHLVAALDALRDEGYSIDTCQIDTRQIDACRIDARRTDV